MRVILQCLQIFFGGALTGAYEDYYTEIKCECGRNGKNLIVWSLVFCVPDSCAAFSFCAALRKRCAWSAEKMRVSLPFGVFRRSWAGWKALAELFCLVWCGKLSSHTRIYCIAPKLHQIVNCEGCARSLHASISGRQHFSETLQLLSYTHKLQSVLGGLAKTNLCRHQTCPHADLGPRRATRFTHEPSFWFGSFRARRVAYNEQNAGHLWSTTRPANEKLFNAKLLNILIQ